MILVGRYASPYVRRTGICMHLLGIQYDRVVVSPITEPEKVKAFNSMGRVPVLILDDGTRLVESLAIVDFLIEEAGDDTLWPRRGPERRRIGQLVALMSTALEKAIYAFYETIKRPEDKRHPPFVETLHGHVGGGLAALEGEVGPGWLVAERLTLADVAVATGWRALRGLAPEQARDERYPGLAAHSARCEDLPAFIACEPERA